MKRKVTTILKQWDLIKETNSHKNNSRENHVVCHTSMVSYSPQQHSIVERKNRIIFYITWSMLKNKKMPREFWVEVVICVVYLLNQSPSSSIWNKTPRQAWNGGKLGIAYLRVFGSIACVKSKAIEVRWHEQKYIFIVYNSSSKGYIINKDVKFN